MSLNKVLFIFGNQPRVYILASYAIASNSAPPRRPSSNMADDDDVGTAASGGGEAHGQVKSISKFGSGKVATVFVKALEQSRRTLDDDDYRLTVADFAYGGRAFDGGFADPEWDLPEYIAQRDELLASWRETYIVIHLRHTYLV